ncbi:MAG: Gfo/Idh/MocA family oxidoreductase [Pedobacter sp.]|uniref:Gfo/Idh/MocA family protein n=1 Tax=Pedobacter sp. TaxID=1411316 RepID=UPI00356AB9B6
MKPTIDLQHQIKMPLKPFSIIVIGAGGIVKDGHLPAYKKADWHVLGIFDPALEKANKLAEEFDIENVYTSLKEAISSARVNTVFDVAVPASAIVGVLDQLPEKAIVLIQKPMGENISEADKIMKICKEKQFVAAINFQMRFIPSVVAAKKIVDSGLIGDLHDVEIRMNIYHPWHLWEFLFHIPRMEMLYHSIHYMDLLRYFFGEPQKVYAKTWKHPKMMQLASTRSIIFLEYDEIIKAHINTNHGHEFGLKHQDSFIKLEGTKGAIKATLGMNINYPDGVADTFEYVILEEGKEPEWQSVSFEASWFPDAFIGSMANLMCYVEGSSDILINHIDSAYQTMALVEAAYESSEHGGVISNKYQFSQKDS